MYRTENTKRYCNYKSEATLEMTVYHCNEMNLTKSRVLWETWRQGNFKCILEKLYFYSQNAVSVLREMENIIHRIGYILISLKVKNSFVHNILQIP